MAPTFNLEENCALNADGTLKDAKDIQFFNDLDDDVPLPPVTSDGPAPDLAPDAVVSKKREFFDVDHCPCLSP